MPAQSSSACVRVTRLAGILSLFMLEAGMANESIYPLPRLQEEGDACLNPILRERRTTRSFASRASAKREVIVYDYVDSGVALLARMALKRQIGYRSLGYEVAVAATPRALSSSGHVSGNAR